MKVWLEWGPIGDTVAFGFGFCWEDHHLKQYRFYVDIGHWYFNLYLRIGGNHDRD